MVDIIKMNNGINVSIDKGEIKGISIYELEEHIKGLFEIKKTYHKSEVIMLSELCDCFFNLMFCGSNKNTKEMSFRLC